jgi:hypothetical protein
MEFAPAFQQSSSLCRGKVAARLQQFVIRWHYDDEGKWHYRADEDCADEPHYAASE